MTKKLLLAAGAVLALLLVWVVWFWQPAGDRAHQTLSLAAAPLGGDFTLHSADGPVALKDLRGKVVLVYFGYTFCPDICPTTLLEMAEVLRRLGDEAGALQGIFVSVDPERDTPKSLKTYTAFFDPRILGLTGSAELVQRAARNFKVRYAKVPGSSGQASHYAVDHSAGMYLLDRDGGFLKKFAYGTPPEQIADAIRAHLHGG